MTRVAAVAPQRAGDTVPAVSEPANRWIVAAVADPPTSTDS